MTQEKFNEIINRKIFEENLTHLLIKIAKYPDRYVGLFRPTKPYSKIIQNISQSYEIRFGEALENIFEEYLLEAKFEILPTKIKLANDRTYNIDLLFKKNDTIYMVEQKVRDDHDSTKKRGQYMNFSEKYEIIENLYKNHKIISIMWFIDASLTKNKKYYSKEISKEVLQKDIDSLHLAYGEDFFTIENTLFEISFWCDFISKLTTCKQNIPDFPNVNFDDDSSLDDIIHQISPNKTSNTIWKKLFEDDRIVNDIFPVIFPTGASLKLYLDKFNDNSKRSEEIYVLMKKYIASIVQSTDVVLFQNDIKNKNTLICEWWGICQEVCVREIKKSVEASNIGYKLIIKERNTPNEMA